MTFPACREPDVTVWIGLIPEYVAGTERLGHVDGSGKIGHANSTWGAGLRCEASVDGEAVGEFERKLLILLESYELSDIVRIDCR